MTRFKLTVEYDGTGLAGWQRQDDRDSVQSLLEAAAEKLTGVWSEVVGAGRTDAGVHASAQVAHIDIGKPIKPYNVMQGLNYHLAPLTAQVVVLDAIAVNDTFHARFSAISRRYRYTIVNRRARLALDRERAWHIHDKLDVQAMHEAAQLLVGHHDFSSFRSSQCQSKSAVKTLDRMDVQRENGHIVLYAESRSFLHHQVRNMAGSLKMVGNGKWSRTALQAVLDAKNRAYGGETAPAQGLTLTEVIY